MNRLYRIEFIKVGSLTHHTIYVEATSFCQVGKIIERVESEQNWKFETVGLSATQYDQTHPELKVWIV